jgi:dipeptidyl aminopeptidase/acylaminoacyl peptidase
MKSLLNKITGFALVLLLFISFSAHAQKANFELAERFTTSKLDKMVGSTVTFPRWLDYKDQFWYQYETSEGKDWYYVDAAAGRKRQLFDKDDLAAQLAETFNKPFDAKDLPLRSFDYDEDKGLFTFHVDSVNFTYSLSGNLVKGDSLEKEERLSWATYSPDSTWIAFAKNHQLYVMRADDPDSTEIQLTEDGELWFSYQAADDDTTTDKRLRSIANWFEDETKLWVKRTDWRKVPELWVINSLKKRPELETYKYSMPGEEDIYVEHIEVFDMESKERVRMDTDKWEDQALGGAYFNGGGIVETEGSDYLWIMRRDRTWSKIDVLKANTSTGEVQVLFSEESKPYFNTRFAELAVINEGQEYIWWSERTGWGQFYLYDAEGNLKNRITSGNFVAGDVVKIDTTARTLYFNSYGYDKGSNPYYSNLHKVNFDGSGFRKLTNDNANHRVYPSEKSNYFVVNASRADMPGYSYLIDGNGKKVSDLEEVDVSLLMETEYKYPENFKVKAADGVTDIHGVMWKPFDFDSTKKYPIITYVYPGPQTEPFPINYTISGSRGRPAALAQLGFVVVAMGQRGGSPLRNKFYHNYGYGDLRDYPLADNKYGLEQLAARHDFIDISRVGIYGHSGGGFMSTAALLSYPEFYDVAVSSAGNHDNNVYNIWWSEVHNGVKEKRKTVKEMGEDSVQVEKEVITFDAPIETNAELAGNLQGHLLLVHGDMDNNVHPANTIRLADALIKAGKRFDMMILPGRRHGFGPYQDYFNRMTWYYFAEHLLGDYRTNVDFNIPKDSD